MAKKVFGKKILKFDDIELITYDLLGEITTEVLWGGDGAVSQGNFTENPSSEQHSSKEKVLLEISIKNQLIGKISSLKDISNLLVFF